MFVQSKIKDSKINNEFRNHDSSYKTVLNNCGISKLSHKNKTGGDFKRLKSKEHN